MTEHTEQQREDTPGTEKDINKVYFDLSLLLGWCLIDSPGTGTKATNKYEVINTHGLLVSKGKTPDEALTAAWDKLHSIAERAKR